MFTRIHSHDSIEGIREGYSHVRNRVLLKVDYVNNSLAYEKVLSNKNLNWAKVFNQKEFFVRKSIIGQKSNVIMVR